jgi:hypothetical protein
MHSFETVLQEKVSHHKIETPCSRWLIDEICCVGYYVEHFFIGTRPSFLGVEITWLEYYIL